MSNYEKRLTKEMREDEQEEEIKFNGECVICEESYYGDHLMYCPSCWRNK